MATRIVARKWTWARVGSEYIQEAGLSIWRVRRSPRVGMVRTSTPAQDRQALLMKGTLATLAGEIRAIVRERAGRARRYTETPLKRTMTGAVQQADAADEAGASDGASQLIRSVRRLSESSRQGMTYHEAKLGRRMY